MKAYYSLSSCYDSDIKMKGRVTMASALPIFTLRVQEELLAKVRAIAEKNKRSANKEIEFVLTSYVADYEKQHGPISVD